MTGRLDFAFYVSVAVGMALSTSVFTMLAGMFGVASSTWLLGGILIAGLVCAAIALSIAEVASMFPSAPGIRTYMRMAFGERASLILIYLYLFLVVLMSGVESCLFALVAQAAVPTMPALPVALGLIVLVAVVNLSGYELPRGFQIVTTYAAVAFLLGASVHGVASPLPEADGVFDPGGGWASALSLPGIIGMAIFLYMGFEWVTPLGTKPRSYEFQIPAAMPIAVALLAVTYCLFTAGLAARIPRAVVGSQTAPQILFLESLYGRSGVVMALVLSFCAVSSTFNAGLMGGSRLVYMLGREGHLPAWSATMWLRATTPVGAIAALGGLALLSAVLVWKLDALLIAAVVSAWISCVVYGAFMLSALVLRRTKPNARRPYRSHVPSGMQWALVGILPVVGVLTLVSDLTVAASAVWLAFGCLAVAIAGAHLSLECMKRERMKAAGNVAIANRV